MGETENREQRSLGKHKILTVVLALADNCVPKTAIKTLLCYSLQNGKFNLPLQNYYFAVNVTLRLPSHFLENLFNLCLALILVKMTLLVWAC